MVQNEIKKLRFINKPIALSIGILMNPVLFGIVFFVDAYNKTADSGTQITLLERTPFAYIYFWASAFLPLNPTDPTTHFLLAVVGNTVLYTFLSYFILSRLRSEKLK
jgi:hypothetical protein